MSLRRRGLLQAYMSVILMGIGITVVQTIDLPPQTQVWYRAVTALPVLFLFALFSGKSLRVVPRFRLPLFAAALLTGVHWICLFYSITMSTVAVGMISFYSYPVFSTLFEALLQKRKPFRKDVVISVLSFLGVIMLTPLTGASLEMLPGVCVGVISAVFWAARMVLIHHRLRELSGLNMMFWSMILMSVFLLPTLWDTTPPWQWTHATLRSVLILGLFVTAFCQTLLLASLRHLSATLVGQVSPIQIVSASLAGWFFLQEPLTLRIVAGGILIASTGIVAALLSGKAMRTDKSPLLKKQVAGKPGIRC